jgi:hypothetical protein
MQSLAIRHLARGVVPEPIDPRAAVPAAVVAGTTTVRRTAGEQPRYEARIGGCVMRVEQTPLPGVGIRYDFCTAAGRQVGVLVRRDGNADLIVYAADDPEYVIE